MPNGTVPFSVVPRYGMDVMMMMFGLMRML